MDSVRIDSRNTKMVAHRGLSGIELENTNASFIAAGNRSYFGIETDVHKTKDGRFVVFHDDSTGRLCDTDVIVEETEFSVLRAMHLNDKYGDATRADTLIPTLKEFTRSQRMVFSCSTAAIRAKIRRNRIPLNRVQALVYCTQRKTW